ncbi:LRR receptor-like serine/threonine-protein kinase EFR [Lactuca sativa]|uniref:LRR receptor-like serine/threonine-protein kinase EFR n=1 Tax=Lactuca sativa TaxID=4236 RepID=UPI0022AF4A47|nr:LRR receptor-like serine/threonine-protein kinase EFR [Lactuca sativa]
MLNLYAVSETLSTETDKQALISIKSQTFTHPPEALATWDPASSSPCNWTRVLCDDRNGRVVGLDLSSLQITGPVSPFIGNLSFLRSLHLQNNQFYGILPETITNLFSLQVLNVSFNRIQGTIPANISHCIDLRVVDFMQNKLSGSIPESLTVLKNLRTLNLARNNISGFIPPSIGNLTSLSTLRLCTNKLSGRIPSELSALRNLKILDLNINKLTGILPPSFYNMSSLEVFAVASNDLWGNIPYNVGETLPNLLDFNFCLNRFTGTIPGSLHNLTNIRSIRMQHNQLHGTLPRGPWNLPMLTRYNIGQNNIVSAQGEGLGFLNSLVNSTKLGFLAIDGNNFDGFIPESIGNLSKILRIMFMGSNRISGIIPSSIGQLKGLALLNLGYNSISGQIPPELGQLEDLQKLVLVHSLEKVVTIDLSNNNLSGDIPNSIHNCKSLEQLIISKNSLSGNIPNSLGELRGLLVLDLSSNQLSGSIPLELQSLNAIKILNLSFNKLEGNVPSNGFFSNLTRVHLEGNPKLCYDSKCTRERLRVAIDVACGLTYLHHECVVAPVVHCDLKPSNILLDEDFTAKIGDFGLASILVEKDQYVDVLKGSMGYIPPEYGMGENPSTKGDVYNYGIMLMEIFTGKRPTDDIFVGGLSLKIWVQSAFPSNLDLVLDPYLIQELEELWSEELRLEEWYSDGHSMNQKMPHDCLTIIIGVALSCTNDSPHGRIVISEALDKLKIVQDMLRKS